MASMEGTRSPNTLNEVLVVFYILAYFFKTNFQSKRQIKPSVVTGSLVSFQVIIILKCFTDKSL